MSTRLSDILAGGASGAMAGNTFGGTWGKFIGGAIGIGAALFSPNAEDERKKRISDLINSYNQMRDKELAALEQSTQKNIGNLNSYVTGQKSQSAAGIARRNTGRGDNEAYILSANNNIDTQGSNSLKDILSSSDAQKMSINKSIDSAIMGAQLDNANAPLPATALDAVQTIAGPIASYNQNKDYIDTLKTLGVNPSTVKTPGTDIPAPPSGSTLPSTDIGKVTNINGDNTNDMETQNSMQLLGGMGNKRRKLPQMAW